MCRWSCRTQRRSAPSRCQQLRATRPASLCLHPPSSSPWTSKLSLVRSCPLPVLSPAACVAGRCLCCRPLPVLSPAACVAARCLCRRPLPILQRGGMASHVSPLSRLRCHCPHCHVSSVVIRPPLAGFSRLSLRPLPLPVLPACASLPRRVVVSAASVACLCLLVLVCRCLCCQCCLPLPRRGVVSTLASSLLRLSHTLSRAVYCGCPCPGALDSVFPLLRGVTAAGGGHTTCLVSHIR